MAYKHMLYGAWTLRIRMCGAVVVVVSEMPQIFVPRPPRAAIASMLLSFCSISMTQNPIAI